MVDQFGGKEDELVVKRVCAKCGPSIVLESQDVESCCLYIIFSCLCVTGRCGNHLFLISIYFFCKGIELRMGVTKS